MNGNGIFAPLMLIIKHSVSSEVRPDQTRMRVIHELFKEEGFTNLNGWSIKIWQKELTIKRRQYISVLTLSIKYLDMLSRVSAKPGTIQSEW